MTDELPQTPIGERMASLEATVGGQTTAINDGFIRIEKSHKEYMDKMDALHQGLVQKDGSHDTEIALVRSDVREIKKDIKEHANGNFHIPLRFFKSLGTIGKAVGYVSVAGGLIMGVVKFFWG